MKIGIVGKYFQTGNFTLTDSYISVIEAIKHAAWFYKVKPELSWLSSESYEKDSNNLKQLKEFDAIIVPGGFGNRGIKGKIKVIEYCRKNKIPFLGLCLGMQLTAIEFSRNVCGLKQADSTEFNLTTKQPVIDIMPDQKNILKHKQYGATMRLGNYDCLIKKNTRAYSAYLKSNWGKKDKKNDILVQERHRHRYELNNQFRQEIESKGLTVSGVNPEKDLVEIVEISNHPFFIAVQFHPEFKSKPLNPHPLFKELIKTTLKNK